MTIGYFDCSQRNIDVDKKRDIVNQYTHDNFCLVDIFLGKPIKNIKDNINSLKNTLIMTNIICLGSKLGHVYSVVPSISVSFKKIRK